MKPLATILLLCSALNTFSGTARGELKVVPGTQPVSVFSGTARPFSIAWQNTGAGPVSADVRMRLLQITSATATTLAEQPWKTLQVLPGQTVTESATVDFPQVRAETRFLIQWIEPTNHAFGTTEVLVYPTNLLAELETLAGERLPVGVFDPGNLLKPLLNALKIDCEDLQESGVAHFAGKLAIVGPFDTREQMSGDLRERIEKLARKGTGVVWMQPPPGSREKLEPSFRIVPVGAGAVVVVQAQLIGNLADSPQAQLNLIQLCRLAREPETPALPGSLNQR